MGFLVVFSLLSHHKWNRTPLVGGPDVIDCKKHECDIANCFFLFVSSRGHLTNILRANIIPFTLLWLLRARDSTFRALTFNRTERLTDRAQRAKHDNTLSRRRLIFFPYLIERERTLVRPATSRWACTWRRDVSRVSHYEILIGKDWLSVLQEVTIHSIAIMGDVQ